MEEEAATVSVTVGVSAGEARPPSAVLGGEGRAGEGRAGEGRAGEGRAVFAFLEELEATRLIASPELATLLQMATCQLRQGRDVLYLFRVALHQYLPLCLPLKQSLPHAATHYSLLITHYSLLTTRCSLLTTRYSLPTTHYPLHTTHYSLLTAHSSLLTPHSSLLTTHSSQLIAHNSQLTAHHLSLAAYSPPPPVAPGSL